MTPTMPIKSEPLTQATFPIAEIFSSLQGEGLWAGTAMTFIRLAGCTVGRPYTPAAREALELNVYQERCTGWDGVSFACDTNYRMYNRLSVLEIMDRPELDKALRVCITGGEPLMHGSLHDLVFALHKRGIQVHLETSGTLHPDVVMECDWVAVSPKLNALDSMLLAADEIKVLVGPSFNEELFLTHYEKYFAKSIVWVGPINSEHALDTINMQKCIELIHRRPQLRLSTQMHKIWSVR